MSGTTRGLTRQQMADRIAFEFQDNWIVNLGVGIPTMCSNTDIGDRDVTYHAENGVIGYGPIAPAGQEDLNLVNAGGQNVTLKPGAAVVHHADRGWRQPCRDEGAIAGGLPAVGPGATGPGRGPAGALPLTWRRLRVHMKGWL